MLPVPDSQGESPPYSYPISLVTTLLDATHPCFMDPLALWDIVVGLACPGFPCDDLYIWHVLLFLC